MIVFLPTFELNTILQFISRIIVMATQLCYNRGCGKQFKIKDNHDEACTFHPGAPYFHDAYKGWTCCQNKSTDFTTFLSTPGCSVGRHSNVKPVEPEKITGNLSKEGLDNEVELETNLREVRSCIIRMKKPLIGPSS